MSEKEAWREAAEQGGERSGRSKSGQDCWEQDGETQRISEGQSIGLSLPMARAEIPTTHWATEPFAV